MRIGFSYYKPLKRRSAVVVGLDDVVVNLRTSASSLPSSSGEHFHFHLDSPSRAHYGLHASRSLQLQLRISVRTERGRGRKKNRNDRARKPRRCVVGDKKGAPSSFGVRLGNSCRGNSRDVSLSLVWNLIFSIFISFIKEKHGESFSRYVSRFI